MHNRIFKKGTGGSSTFPLFFKIIAAVAIIAFTLSNIYKIDTLFVSDMRTSEYVKAWRAKEGSEFTIKYTHSVELTPVWEVYEIREGKIILKETVFQSFGAGLPSTSPYEFDIVDDGFRLSDINLEMTDLIYRVGKVRANHQIIIGGNEYPFLDFAKPEEGLKFETKQMSYFEFITKEGFK